MSSNTHNPENLVFSRSKDKENSITTSSKIINFLKSLKDE
jgi:hypothetical protein